MRSQLIIELFLSRASPFRCYPLYPPPSFREPVDIILASCTSHLLPLHPLWGLVKSLESSDGGLSRLPPTHAPTHPPATPFRPYLYEARNGSALAAKELVSSFVCRKNTATPSNDGIMLCPASSRDRSLFLSVTDLRLVAPSKHCPTRSYLSEISSRRAEYFILGEICFNRGFFESFFLSYSLRVQGVPF